MADGATAEEPEQDRYVIAAVDRALRLLEILAETSDLGVTEIARRMGVSKALAFRLLHTLERRDYVMRDPKRRTNALGYRLLNLADKVEHHSLIVSATAKLMDELARETGEDVNLFVRVGLNSLCVGTRASSYQVRMFAEVGRRSVLHAGGSSTVLLAFAPKDVQDAVLASSLTAFTPNTVTDPERLTARLAEIRRNGYHLSRADVDESGFAIGAPVYGYGGEVVAAISIAGSISRLTPESTLLYRDLVGTYAARMSAELGGDPVRNAARRVSF
jgi:IclR family transcriptional regulator, KDG regulon repressor